jgi:hypothetical protein
MFFTIPRLRNVQGRLSRKKIALFFLFHLPGKKAKQ